MPREQNSTPARQRNQGDHRVSPRFRIDSSALGLRFLASFSHRRCRRAIFQALKVEEESLLCYDGCPNFSSCFFLDANLPIHRGPAGQEG